MPPFIQRTESSGHIQGKIFQVRRTVSSLIKTQEMKLLQDLIRKLVSKGKQIQRKLLCLKVDCICPFYITFSTCFFTHVFFAMKRSGFYCHYKDGRLVDQYDEGKTIAKEG